MDLLHDKENHCFWGIIHPDNLRQLEKWWAEDGLLSEKWSVDYKYGGHDPNYPDEHNSLTVRLRAGGKTYIDTAYVTFAKGSSMMDMAVDCLKDRCKEAMNSGKNSEGSNEN